MLKSVIFELVRYTKNVYDFLTINLGFMSELIS